MSALDAGLKLPMHFIPNGLEFICRVVSPTDPENVRKSPNAELRVDVILSLVYST